MISSPSQRWGHLSIFTNIDWAISCLFKCILCLQIWHRFFCLEFWQKCGNWCLPRANWGMSSIEVVVFHGLTRWAWSHNNRLIHLIKNSFLPDREISCVVHAQTEWWCFLQLIKVFLKSWIVIYVFCPEFPYQHVFNSLFIFIEKLLYWRRREASIRPYGS